MERLSLLYASALFDIALKHDAVQEFLDQATYLRNTMQDAGYLRLLTHPNISALEKKALFKSAYSGSIHSDLLGFLFLTTDKNREEFIVPALTALIGMIDRYHNKVTATVTTATALDEGQTHELEALISDRLSKTVDLSLKIDPSIIGGPYVFVDGYYINWTVKQRLHDLTTHMKEGCSA